MNSSDSRKEASFAHFIILGPEGSGKTSLAQQLQSLFNRRNIVYPPRYLKVSPTAGQELLTIVINERLVKSSEDTCWSEYAAQLRKDKDSHSNVSGSREAPLSPTRKPIIPDAVEGGIRLGVIMTGVDRLITKPEMGDCHNAAEGVTRKEMCAMLDYRKDVSPITVSLPSCSTRILPDEISSKRPGVIELQEVGGKLMSMWPRFLSKLDFGFSETRGEKPSACLIYVVDLTNPGQLPAAAMELHNILYAYFPGLLEVAAKHAQSPTGGLLEGNHPPHYYSRLAIIANKITVLQHGTPETVTPAKIVEIKKRLRSLLMLPSEAYFVPSPYSTPMYEGDQVIPIFVTDTWYGTGLGDVVRWIETR